MSRPSEYCMQNKPPTPFFLFNAPPIKHEKKKSPRHTGKSFFRTRSFNVCWIFRLKSYSKRSKKKYYIYILCWTKGLDAPQRVQSFNWRARETGLLLFAPRALKMRKIESKIFRCFAYMYILWIRGASVRTETLFYPKGSNFVTEHFIKRK